MSVAAARRLWLIAGLVVAVLALNLVAVTQSWGAVIDIPVVVFLDWDGGEDGIRPLQAALYGSGLVPVGVALVGLLGGAHARNPELSPRDHWAERMPLRVKGVVPRGRAGSIMAGGGPDPLRPRSLVCDNPLRTGGGAARLGVLRADRRDGGGLLDARMAWRLPIRSPIPPRSVERDLLRRRHVPALPRATRLGRLPGRRHGGGRSPSYGALPGSRPKMIPRATKSA